MSLKDKVEFDGLWQSRFKVQPHEDRVYRELTQVNRTALLEENQRRRNIQQRKMDWGRMLATIPAEDWELLERKYPELRSKDPEIKRRKLFEILKSPEGAPFLVVDKSKV